MLSNRTPFSIRLEVRGSFARDRTAYSQHGSLVANMIFRAQLPNTLGTGDIPYIPQKKCAQALGLVFAPRRPQSIIAI